jgi:hypothetical protein
MTARISAAVIDSGSRSVFEVKNRSPMWGDEAMGIGPVGAGVSLRLGWRHLAGTIESSQENGGGDPVR